MVTALRALHASVRDAAVSGSDMGDGARTISWRDPSRLVEILAQQPPTLSGQRAQMVSAIRADILARGQVESVALDRVLAAIRAVPREAFMPEAIQAFAYLPGAFALEHGQTISDPHLVTVMTLAADLRPDAHVLDVGTGSGYQAAVLSGLAARVVSLEIIPALAQSARARLQRLGYANVRVHARDATRGMARHALFDAIVVAAGAENMPRALLDLLKPGGRMVMPVGPTPQTEHVLVATKKPDGTLALGSLGPATFVPLTGTGGRGTRHLSNAPGHNAPDVPYAYGAAIT